MAENGRLGRLEGIAKAFSTLMRAHRGQVTAKVTTAKPLDANEMKELNTVLEGFLQKGHQFQLATQVDPELIGGMIIELGDRYIDLSIASKLKNYSAIVKETL